MVSVDCSRRGCGVLNPLTEYFLQPDHSRHYALISKSKVKSMSYNYSRETLKLNLSATQKSVINVLSVRANEFGSCIPSLKTLLSDTNLGRTTVIRVLKELASEKIGLITITPRYRKDGSKTSNRYTLSMARIEELKGTAITAIKAGADAVVEAVADVVEEVIEVAAEVIEVAVDTVKTATKKVKEKVAGGFQTKKSIDLYDEKQFCSARNDICDRVMELYPSADPYAVMGAVCEQLDYWADRAATKKFTLTINQLRAAIIKRESDFFEFLNFRNNTVVLDQGEFNVATLLG